MFKSMRYHSKNHSKYLLQVHIIFSCKYRKQLLKGYIGYRIKQIAFEVSKQYRFNIKICEVDKDHFHLLIDYSPKISILQIVKLLKQITTYYIWNDVQCVEILKNNFWNEKTFWADGYFASSIGDVSYDTAHEYIMHQG